MAEPAETVEDYLASLPAQTRVVLEDVRRTLHGAVPGATETISYGIPALQVDGRSVVYFAGWTQHVSIYPVPDDDPDLEAELEPFRSGRGTVKFPLADPPDLGLVGRIGAGLLRRHERTHPAGPEQAAQQAAEHAAE